MTFQVLQFGSSLLAHAPCSASFRFGGIVFLASCRLGDLLRSDLYHLSRTCALSCSLRIIGGWISGLFALVWWWDFLLDLSLKFFSWCNTLGFVCCIEVFFPCLEWAAESCECFEPRLNCKPWWQGSGRSPVAPAALQRPLLVEAPTTVHVFGAKISSSQQGVPLPIVFPWAQFEEANTRQTDVERKMVGTNQPTFRGKDILRYMFPLQRQLVLRSIIPSVVFLFDSDDASNSQRAPFPARSVYGAGPLQQIKRWWQPTAGFCLKNRPRLSRFWCFADGLRILIAAGFGSKSEILFWRRIRCKEEVADSRN